MLNELTVAQLTTRYHNMVTTYHSFLKNIRFLQSHIPDKKRKIEFLDHTILETNNKVLLIEKCEHMEMLLDCTSTRKQSLVVEARTRCAMTHCPNCDKMVKVKYCFDVPICRKCHNAKGLTVPKYV